MSGGRLEAGLEAVLGHVFDGLGSVLGSLKSVFDGLG